jgi:hypothetical protein
MYVNGSGFREIERVKAVHHTTVITWVKAVGKLLPEAYNPETIPEVGELDELAAIPNSECSQRYKRLDVFTGKGFAMKIAN